MLTSALIGAFLFAQQTPPLFGTWRIDPAQSVIDGPVPALFHNGVIQFRAPKDQAMPYNPSAPIRIIDNSGKEKKIFEVTITSDGRTAFMKEIDSQHHMVLYLQRQ